MVHRKHMLKPRPLIPKQCIQRIFHIPETFSSLAIDYCTLLRVIEVNKVFINKPPRPWPWGLNSCPTLPLTFLIITNETIHVLVTNEAFFLPINGFKLCESTGRNLKKMHIILMLFLGSLEPLNHLFLRRQ